MQKSSNKLKKMLVKYHSVMGDNSLTDSVRHHRLKVLKLKISSYSIKELKMVVITLSKNQGYPMTFRLWCELINLTGDI